MTKLTLRPANLEDVPTLEHWDKQLHVIAASGDDDEWEWKEEITKNSPFVELFIAMLEDRPIGMIQIIDPANEETHYWGKVEQNLRAIDIWIGEADDLGKGYGTEMMNLAFDYCFSKPEVTAIIIDPLASNTNALRFYKRLGFEFVEYRTFGEDECEVLRLERKRWSTISSQST